MKHIMMVARRWWSIRQNLRWYHQTYGCDPAERLTGSVEMPSEGLTPQVESLRHRRHSRA